MNVSFQRLAYNALASCSYNPTKKCVITCGIQPTCVVTMAKKVLHNSSNMYIHDLPHTYHEPR